MKIFISLLTAILLSYQVSSQVFKTKDIFKSSTVALTHWQIIDKKNTAQVDSFLLWGEQRYDESWIAATYEVEFFKGSAKSMFSFLNDLVGFAEKYRNESDVLILIQGVQVVKRYLERIYIYDKGRKVCCDINLRQLATMKNNFVDHCQKNGIVLE